jgi:hypothetical protein
VGLSGAAALAASGTVSAAGVAGGAFTPARVVLAGYPWTPTLTGTPRTAPTTGTPWTPTLTGTAHTHALTGTAYAPTLTGAPS